jgi:hypothetical protein
MGAYAIERIAGDWRYGTTMGNKRFHREIDSVEAAKPYQNMWERAFYQFNFVEKPEINGKSSGAGIPLCGNANRSWLELRLRRVKKMVGKGMSRALYYLPSLANSGI